MNASRDEVLRGYAAAHERAIERRDFDAEVAASEQYEELRLLSKDELERRAGFRGSRQQLIAHLIEAGRLSA